MCQLECRLRVARKGLTAGSGRYPAYLPACVRGPEAGAGSCGSVGNRRCEREGTYRRKEGVEPKVRLHRTRRRGGLQKAGNGHRLAPENRDAWKTRRTWLHSFRISRIPTCGSTWRRSDPAIVPSDEISTALRIHRCGYLARQPFSRPPHSRVSAHRGSRARYNSDPF